MRREEKLLDRRGEGYGRIKVVKWWCQWWY